jgi:membrane-associated phospholipid phosphatase
MTGKPTAPGGSEQAALGLRPAQRARRTRRMGGRAVFVGGLAAIIVAVLLGLLIAIREGGIPLELDEEWAEDVFALRGPFGDVVALLMNRLGGGFIGVFVVPLAAAVVLLLVRRPWGALYFIAASAASAGVVQLLKSLFGRARPEDMLVTSDFGSFPSGHVANAATIAIAVAVIAPAAWVWVSGAAYTVLMALSRTYLGVHWLTDTIGGVLVGVGVALIVWAFFGRLLERERLARAASAAQRNAELAQAHITPPAAPRS